MAKRHQDTTDTIAVQLTDGTWSASLRGPELTGISGTEALAQIDLAFELERRAQRIRDTYTAQANRDALRAREIGARIKARRLHAAPDATLSRNLNPTQADADAAARGLANVIRKER